MSPASGLVTVLLRLSLYYNPDAAGQREAVEDETFMRTAHEIAQRFGGGTLFTFRHDEPWLRTYARDVLLDRFRQKAIYLKFVKPVEQLIVTDEEVRCDP